MRIHFQKGFHLHPSDAVWQIIVQEQNIRVQVLHLLKAILQRMGVMNNVILPGEINFQQGTKVLLVVDDQYFFTGAQIINFLN